jgi:hypothetical protein
VLFLQHLFLFYVDLNLLSAMFNYGIFYSKMEIYGSKEAVFRDNWH